MNMVFPIASPFQSQKGRFFEWVIFLLIGNKFNRSIEISKFLFIQKQGNRPKIDDLKLGIEGWMQTKSGGSSGGLIQILKWQMV